MTLQYNMNIEKNCFYLDKKIKLKNIIENLKIGQKNYVF